MYTLPSENTICLQQVVSGTGTFTGVPVGYARYAYSVSGAQFTVRARHLGSETYNLCLLVPPTNNPSTTARWDATLNTCFVMLAFAGGAITARASDVVNAINNTNQVPGYADDNYGMPAVSFGGLLPIVAGLVADATITAGLSPTPLTGGLDVPEPNGGPIRFDLAANASGGMFFFEQKIPWRISSVTCRLPTGTTGAAVKIAIVNVDGALNALANEEVAVWEPTTVDNYAALEDMQTPILPGQALQVIIANKGLVRVTARPEAVRSYL